jgi:hypothetical protein
MNPSSFYSKAPSLFGFPSGQEETTAAARLIAAKALAAQHLSSANVKSKAANTSAPASIIAGVTSIPVCSVMLLFISIEKWLERPVAPSLYIRASGERDRHPAARRPSLFGSIEVNQNFLWAAAAHMQVSGYKAR